MAPGLYLEPPGAPLGALVRLWGGQGRPPGDPGALLEAPWGCFWRSLDASKIALWCCMGARECPELFKFEGPNVNSDHACYGLLTSRRSELEV